MFMPEVCAVSIRYDGVGEICVRTRDRVSSCGNGACFAAGTVTNE